MNKITVRMILRAIKASAGRFAAIFAISALGVGFLAGISAATPDMALSGSRYFTQNNLADVQLASNIGLDERDVEALRQIEGIKDIMAVKSADILFVEPSGSTVGVTVIGIKAQNFDGGSINRLTLTEGRMPQNTSECLVESSVSAVGYAGIGDVLTLSPQNDQDIPDDFSPTRLTVVGVVENPYYMAMQRQQTTVGNGKISEVIYVPEESFLTDYYPYVYMTVQGAGQQLSMGDEYWQTVDPVVEAIEDLSEVQKYSRHDRVVGEARQKIDDAWQEYYQKKAEADDEFAKAEEKMAQAEIDIAGGKRTLAEKEAEGRQEIADGERQLADALVELEDGQREYQEGLLKYQDGLAELEDGKADYLKGLEEYNEGRDDYLEGKREYEKGLREYEDGKKEYDDGMAKLEEARLRLVRGENKITMGYDAIDEGRTALNEAQRQLDETAAGVASMLGLEGVTTARVLIAAAHSDPMIEAALGPYLQQLEGGQGVIDQNRQELADGERQLQNGASALADGWEEYYEGEAELKEAKRRLLDARLTLDDARRELEKAEKKLADAEAELADGYKELEDGQIELLDAQRELEEAEIDLKEGWQEYYDGLNELEEGKAELEREVAKARADIARGESDLADGRRDYEQAKADANIKLADAWYEITDAETKLEDISQPKWYILDRTKMITPAGFDSNIEKVASIAKVFPVFFFLIAALVCLTTMTRMVEEERGVIGTMKALGYSSGAVSAKYMIYAFAASVLGSAVGLGAGFKIFPTVIWNAYRIMYRLPYLYTPFNFTYAALSSLSTIACTMGATWWVCRESLGESAASLMLPKAPQPGKRVFLEHVPFVWSRLRFNEKVTVRNLFRYKKRFFMTVFGVMGCTALLLTGFGLKDSISGILHNQFDVLWKFDLMIGVKDMDKTPIDSRLEAIAQETGGYMAVRQESGTASLNGGASSEVSIYVPSDPETFAADYVIFRRRTDHQAVPFGMGLAVLTEKAASTIGAQVGDVITLVDSEDNEVTVRLDGIIENYIQGFIYMSPDLYAQSFGAPPVYNTLLCKSGGLDPMGREAMAERILKCSSAVSATFTQDTSDDFNDTFKSIDMIVWVLIACAGILAFVVLYNLTNININERHKEIATLKVLGFYEGEVASYVLRETNALSAIGGLVGLGAGKLLHAFVARTAEVDMVMFGRVVSPQSYIISFGLTMAFSLMVSAVMLPKLKKVSMVESLKAPE